MAKVLIVDDDKSIRMLYEEELTNEGYDVFTAGQPEGLLELIERQKPDIVILDIMLGSRNGLDVLQEIRKLWYNMPVILCSAYSTFMSDPRSIAADYYVIKSSDLEELKLKVEMAIDSCAHLSQELLFPGTASPGA